MDDSIESFDLVETAYPNVESVRFAIKFKENTETVLLSFDQLDNYLSSGTIKGITFLTHLIHVMETGGYLIVDEFENHLNKSIVVHLIRLFNSPVNMNGTTLIFSTHYTELIDTINRSDSIYILTRNPEIEMRKLSAVLGSKYDRIDRKKSDLILSGMFGTAPFYDAYLDLTKDLTALLKEGAER